MSFQSSRALFSRAVRPIGRFASRNAGRRTMSSGAPHGTTHVKSDTPWLIGSALIFGPAAVYLLSPPGKGKAHEAKEAALPKHKTSEPAPVPDTPEPEPEPAPSQPEGEEKSETTVSDDEGNKAPASEVQESMSKAIEEDAPKNAEAAEADAPKSGDSESAPAKEATEEDQETKSEPEASK